MSGVIRMGVLAGAVLAFIPGTADASVPAPDSGMAAPAELSRDMFEERLRGFWLAQSIANWTGRRTEAFRTEPPFYTDETWGTVVGPSVLDWVILNPWPADDDTDIEYVYQLLMEEHGPLLTPAQIRDGWIAHINRFIWVSNATARELMNSGMTTPATSVPTANPHWLMIDAQLTTEIFGVVAPGMPRLALELSEAPIRVTASSHAAHAAQFFVVLHALAPVVPDGLTPREQVLWLSEEARRYIPDSSKAADIVDFVTADYLANPDADDWEATRDRIYERYQLNDDQNGFQYRAWYESSINFATGILCLLYGEGDFKRTVQIGTLSGWDSDNPAATMGGLIGLMQGEAAIRAQFPEYTLSERYHSARTRDEVPDFLPDDEAAEDSFTMMASRMMPVIDQAVRLGGGRVDPRGEYWLLPGLPASDPLLFNPLVREHLQSANNAVRAAGGTVTGSASVPSSPPSGFGQPWTSITRDGMQTDQSGVDAIGNTARNFYSSQNSGLSTGDWLTIEVLYDRTVPVGSVRFHEGRHYDQLQARGGYFTEAFIEVRINGSWTAPMFTLSEPLDPAIPFQQIDFVLAMPVEASGVRIVGRVGGPDAFVTCAEIDAMAPDAAMPPQGFDIDGDQRVTAEDAYLLRSSPIDLNGDGTIDEADQQLLLDALRWRELADTATPQ